MRSPIAVGSMRGYLALLALVAIGLTLGGTAGAVSQNGQGGTCALPVILRLVCIADVKILDPSSDKNPRSPSGPG